MPSPAPETVSLAFEGMPWQLALRLADAGAMPAMRKLMASGVSGLLRPCRAHSSAAFWLSAATGVPAGQHGVYTGFEPRPDGFGPQPVTRCTLRAEPFWEVMAASGVRAAAVGWPATRHTCAPGCYVVSDAFAVPNASRYESWVTMPGSLHPPEIRSRADGLRLHPSDISPEQVGFVAAGATPETRLKIAGVLAACATVQSVATDLFQQPGTSAVTVYFDLHAALSRLPGVPPEQVCRFTDMLIRTWLRMSGPDTRLLVVGSAGTPSGTGRQENRTGGFVLAGAGDEPALDSDPAELFGLVHGFRSGIPAGLSARQTRRGCELEPCKPPG